MCLIDKEGLGSPHSRSRVVAPHLPHQGVLVNRMEMERFPVQS